MKITSGSLDEDRIIFSVMYVNCAGVVDLHTYEWVFTSVLQCWRPAALECTLTLTSWVTSSRVIWLSPWSSWVRVLTDSGKIKRNNVKPWNLCIKTYHIKHHTVRRPTWWCWRLLSSPGSTAPGRASLPPGRQSPLSLAHCWSQSPGEGHTIHTKWKTQTH